MIENLSFLYVSIMELLNLYVWLKLNDFLLVFNFCVLNIGFDKRDIVFKDLFVSLIFVMFNGFFILR